jgi:hypothetical protein
VIPDDARSVDGCDLARMSIRAVFADAKEPREVAEGDTVFIEGDAGQEMFGLISGTLELRTG